MSNTLSSPETSLTFYSNYFYGNSYNLDNDGYDERVYYVSNSNFFK